MCWLTKLSKLQRKSCSNNLLLSFDIEIALHVHLATFIQQIQWAFISNRKPYAMEMKVGNASTQMWVYQWKELCKKHLRAVYMEYKCSKMQENKTA